MSSPGLQFVSAQPDELAFVWQTRVYLTNLVGLGVEQRAISALFGVGESGEPSDALRDLCATFPDVDFAMIVDDRDERARSYPPSIQPYLIEKWLRINPKHQGAPTFFHDCDVIFRRLPDFDAIMAEHGDACVMSDTDAYIGAGYLDRAAASVTRAIADATGQDTPVDLIDRMAAVVGIDVGRIRSEPRAGGAQYLYTGVGPEYWGKVFRDSLALHDLFGSYGDDIGLDGPLREHLQVWTAGMWAYLWNLWYFERPTAVSDELAFLFGGESLGKPSPIIHMAGDTDPAKPALFNKRQWHELDPVAIARVQPYRFDHVAGCTASGAYVDVIHEAAGVRPPGVATDEPARKWRVLAWHSGPTNEIWDLQRIHLRFDRETSVIERFASGYAGSGFEVDNAFGDDDTIWGGRPDTTPGRCPELYVGVGLDVAAIPTEISIAHGPSDHRPHYVIVQRCDDNGDWVTTRIARTPTRKRQHAVLYAPADAPGSTAWRAVTTEVADGFAWDVSSLRFERRGHAHDGVWSSSGDAGDGWGVANLTTAGSARWGGRSDDTGRFHVTIRFDTEHEVDRVVLEQGESHWARSVAVERLVEDGTWQVVKRFDNLVPGLNELYVAQAPPVLVDEPDHADDRPRRVSPHVARPAPECPSPPSPGRFDDRRILVLIASYRDRELPLTIANALAQAAYPEHLRFAICEQYDEATASLLDRWRDDPRFRIDSVPSAQSGGCGWARNRTFGLYDGEPYILQIDAHTRFAARWDVRYIDMLESIDAELAILSTYPPSYRYDGDQLQYDLEVGVQRLVIQELRDDLSTLQVTQPVADLSRPESSPSLAAGQLFTRGRFCRDVPYDPDIYFAGEEISLAARAYTSGYDLYCPNENLVWHLYDHREPKHWDDHAGAEVAKHVAAERLRALFSDGEPSLGVHGLGTVRSLADFEQYSGLALGAVSGDRAPRPEGRGQGEIAQPDGGRTVQIDIDRGLIEPRDDYVAFMVVFLDADGAELERRALHGPDVLELRRDAVTLHDCDPAGATSYAVVPTRRNGEVGRVRVRPLRRAWR